ncbi:MAG: c-type cytochrome [Alphaproteobacteria bacterium]|nr:c-type cytochrome [Alphaproteobacteria bacterium]
MRKVLVGTASMVLALAAVALFVLSSIYVHVQSLDVGEPPPQPPDAVRLGAAHYELGCAACHGAPGRPASALQGAMRPSPPSFAEAASLWSPRHLFLVVLNGRKNTGMPAWIARRREDEVWPVVAFLGRIPELDATSYRKLAGIEVGRPTSGLQTGASRERLNICARCHGLPGAPPPIDIVPQLSGQSRDYLLRSLRDYAEGRRPSGYMQLVATWLDDKELESLASAYAGAPAPSGDEPGIDTALLDRGEAIARGGVPAKGVPACLACHVDARNPAFPEILGLSRRYIGQQIRLFQAGHRQATTYGPIMQAATARLGDEEIEAVAAYLARQQPRATP